MESAIMNLEESVSEIKPFFCNIVLIHFAPLAIIDKIKTYSVLKCLFLFLKVQKADGKLDMIAWQIDVFEKEFQDPESEVIEIIVNN